MSETAASPLPAGALPVGVERANLGVVVSQLVPQVLYFLQPLGMISLRLFGKPVIITSGNDGTHVAGSKHYKWEAVDLRTTDKTPVEQAIFLTIVCDLAQRFELCVFDERQRPGGAHVHVETA